MSSCLAAAPPPPQSQPRQPSAIIAIDGHLFTANRCGSINIIDAQAGKATAETTIGKQLAALTAIDNGRSLLAVDEKSNELILLAREGTALTVTQRLSVPMSPVSVAVAPDETWCAVASLWPRQVTLLRIAATRPGADQQRLQLVVTLDLPFNPRLQVVTPDGKQLIVADSFAGDLALIDVATRKVTALRSIEGHNIRGLAIGSDGSELLIAHQQLSPHTPTEKQRIFWGNTLGNFVRAVRLNHLAEPSSAAALAAGRATPIAHWSLYSPGGAGHGAADPGVIAVLPGGFAAVALAGVDEVVLWPSRWSTMTRVKVGRRPVAVAGSADGSFAYIANQFNDSVSVIDVKQQRVMSEIPLGPQPELSLAQRGEQLFHDGRLSLDGWMSCHSCHSDGHSPDILNDNFADETFDTPKRVLSLLGVGQTPLWAWAGTRTDLKDQIQKSIVQTMHGKPELAMPSNLEAIAAYLRTLPPPPALDVARGTLDAAGFERGKVLFEKLDCVQCHRPPLYTSRATYDVGLADEAGLKKFNPPSLRGVSQRRAFFHDNRAKSLREVLSVHGHGETGTLKANDLEDLLKFLGGL